MEFKYKLLMVVSSVVTVSLILFGVRFMQGRGNPIANISSVKKEPSPTAYFTPTPEASSSSLIRPPSFDTSILGEDDEIDVPELEAYTPFPTFPPLPISTLVPLPTIPAGGYPLPTTYTPPPSCSGVPTAYNSQAYVSSATSLVNSQVTISVELLDCNNAVAPVNDSLTISLSNSDPGTNINGSTPPVTIQAQNGKASFSVNSSNAVTDTFVITDTTRSFTVTDPHNRNPSVAFAYNTAGNANCATPGGIPNAWYSDVYPVSPVSLMIGSAVTFTVVIRDCNRNTVTGSDVVSISLSSGDPTTQVNGNNFPYPVTTTNGQVSFTIISQHAGTNTFVIRDTTSSFTITDPNNQNPSVVFSSPSTPTSTPTLTPTPTLAAGGSPTPSVTPTRTPTPTPSGATPTPSPMSPSPTSQN